LRFQTKEEQINSITTSRAIGISWETVKLTSNFIGGNPMVFIQYTCDQLITAVIFRYSFAQDNLWLINQNLYNSTQDSTCFISDSYMLKDIQEVVNGNNNHNNQ